MNRFLISMLLLIPTMLFQSVATVVIGKVCPLVNFIPILLVLWAWQLDMKTLIWVICAGGLLRDFFVPDALGFGPLTFAFVILLARTQRHFLETYGYLFIMILTFAATLLYLTFHRLAFLTAHEYWSWSLRLSMNIVMAAILNAVISPLCFLVLKPLYRERRQNVLLTTVHH